MILNWQQHPTDGCNTTKIVTAETVEELAFKFKDELMNSMFARWGYYEKIYYPDVHADISYKFETEAEREKRRECEVRIELEEFGKRQEEAMKGITDAPDVPPELQEDYERR